MFFWIGLAVVLVIFVLVVIWGVRGMSEREHEPGTQYLNRKK
jgi:cytochrome oxidase assembly protein ShyY1